MTKVAKENKKTEIDSLREFPSHEVWLLQKDTSSEDVQGVQEVTTHFWSIISPTIYFVM